MSDSCQDPALPQQRKWHSNHGMGLHHLFTNAVPKLGVFQRKAKLHTLDLFTVAQEAQVSDEHAGLSMTSMNIHSACLSCSDNAYAHMILVKMHTCNSAVKRIRLAVLSRLIRWSISKKTIFCPVIHYTASWPQ